MEMGGNFCQILELGGTTIKGRRVHSARKVVMEKTNFANCHLSFGLDICDIDVVL